MQTDPNINDFDYKKIRYSQESKKNRYVLLQVYV